MYFELQITLQKFGQVECTKNLELVKIFDYTIFILTEAIKTAAEGLLTEISEVENKI